MLFLLRRPRSQITDPVSNANSKNVAIGKVAQQFHGRLIVPVGSPPTGAQKSYSSLRSRSADSEPGLAPR